MNENRDKMINSSYEKVNDKGKSKLATTKNVWPIAGCLKNKDSRTCKLVPKTVKQMRNFRLNART